MSEKYTKQTASLKATTADVRIMNAKTIDAKKIKLNGQDIKDLIGGETQLEDKVTRVDLRKLKEDGYCYIVVDDMCKLIGGDFENLESGYYAFKKWPWDEFSINMPNLIDGSNMFCGFEQGVSTFSANVDSLEIAKNMFSNSNITNFISEIPNLKVADEMFSNCNSLSEQSVLHILNCLKFRNSMNTSANIDFSKYMSHANISSWFVGENYDKLMGIFDNTSLEEDRYMATLRGTFTNNSGGVWNVTITIEDSDD